MYITILDHSVKEVFMYDYTEDVTKVGNPTKQGINNILQKFKHDGKLCDVMVHETHHVNKTLFHNHIIDDFITHI